MVDVTELVDRLEANYQEEKDDESARLYNDIVEVLARHKATAQNTLFVMKMIEFGYLQAKYRELVDKAIKIPAGSVPLPKDKSMKEPLEESDLSD